MFGYLSTMLSGRLQFRMIAGNETVIHKRLWKLRIGRVQWRWWWGFDIKILAHFRAKEI